MERLADFAMQQHGIGLNVEVEVSGGCRPGKKELGAAYESLLKMMGFRTAPLKESQLEFAVSLVGFPTSGPQQCGLKLVSMVRQIPTIRVLRLAPGSSSRQYRLWDVEHIITGHRNDLDARLQEQARQDVMDFHQALMEAAGRQSLSR
jgi:hypothetical protein